VDVDSSNEDLVDATKTINDLEECIFQGWYVRRTAMLGWMKFYELEDGMGNKEKYRMGDYRIHDIYNSSAGLAGWSKYYESLDVDDELNVDRHDPQIDIIYDAAVRSGIIDEGKDGPVMSAPHDCSISTFGGQDISSWNRTGAAIMMNIDDQQMIIQVGDNEEVNVLPEEEAVNSPVSKNRQRLIGARSIGGRRMRLKRGITMDSGASANVMPRRMAMAPSRIRPSPGSIAGVKYVAANDGVIKNEGEYDFNFTTVEGHDEVVVMQIAEVNKALGSVAYFVDHGYMVIFDKDAKVGKDLSRMIHKASGRISKFRREKNIWILDAFVGVDQGFIRQGAR